MLVSVIIPVHNRPQPLMLAVDSVLKQRNLGDFDVEVIVVDDHSDPPVTLEGKSVKVITLPTNSGAGAARNAGLRAAAGELVAFLDSDDVWLPNKLVHQVLLMKQVVAAQTETDLHAVTCGFYYPSRIRGQLQARIPYPASQLHQFSGGCWFSPGSTILMPKEVFSRVGPFDECLQCLEDFDWFIRFGALGGHLHVLDSAEVIVFRHRSTRPRPLAQAGAQILNKYSPSGTLPMSRRDFRNLEAYLHLEALLQGTQLLVRSTFEPATTPLRAC